MNVDEFIDPRDVDTIVQKLYTLPTLGDVWEVLQSTFPNWIKGTMPNYCKDYPHLQENWHKICASIGVEPKEIVIVGNLQFDENHKLIQNFADILTRSGFVVRRKEEFLPCKRCNSAIPHPTLYDKMKLAKLSIPDSWSPICQNC